MVRPFGVTPKMAAFAQCGEAASTTVRIHSSRDSAPRNRRAVWFKASVTSLRDRRTRLSTDAVRL